MADPNPAQDNFVSATDFMTDAVEKALVELDKTVNACIDRLVTYNEGLDENFESQLKRIIQQATNFVASNMDDLSAQRDELAMKLTTFEREEIDLLTNGARDSRHKLTNKAASAAESISRLVDEQIGELNSLIENPAEHFNEFKEKAERVIRHVRESSQETLEEREKTNEKALTAKSQEIDETAQEFISDSKRSIERKLEEYENEFDERIHEVLDKLSEVVNSTVQEASKAAKSGAKALEESVVTGQRKLEHELDDWRASLSDIKDSFYAELVREREASENSHGSKLDRKSTNIKDEIDNVASGAHSKIESNHKHYVAAIKRLENRYLNQLDRLFSKFEQAIAQEARLNASASSSRSQTNDQMREKLHANLQARGHELVKTFRRQVEQAESEFARSSKLSHENVDTIRTQTVESLEKQVRTARAELDRIQRNFQNELSRLSMELPQIEEAGHSAAFTVKTYQSTRMSFGND